MMLTELHWVDGPWPGKLALAARPRGGEWLEDEMAYWREAGVDTVVSLLEEAEEVDLMLAAEADEARAHRMQFVSIPIADRQIPRSESKFAKAIEGLDRELSAGKNIVVHCRQGVGRTGLVAGCLLVLKGFEPETALQRLSAARGISMPETEAQQRWIERYGEMLSPR